MYYSNLINAQVLENILHKPNIRIIDCRFSLADTESGRRDFQTEHIPGAVYAHLDEDLSGEIIKGITGRHPFPEVATIVDKLSAWGINAKTQVIIYDQGHGGIAARLWFLLKWLGHNKAAVLNGGWKYWQTVGGAVSSEAIMPKRATFIPKLQKDLLVDMQFMEDNIQNTKCLYIDSRAAARYRGEQEPIDPIAGHIPSAVSVPFLENLGTDGLFLNKKALATRFLELWQTDSQKIFYCGSGVTACHNLLAMNYLGVEKAKLYPGSWSEWIVDSNRSIETNLS